MDKIVVYVTCELCKIKQVYHGQYRCDNCDVRFSPWSIAMQLRKEERREVAQTTPDV